MEKYLLKTNSIQMSIPFFKIALRNIRKNFVQSFVGIWGLVFGLLCFVPALYWLRYEVSRMIVFIRTRIVFIAYILMINRAERQMIWFQAF